jgi:hypothetical protein
VISLCCVCFLRNLDIQLKYCTKMLNRNCPTSQGTLFVDMLKFRVTVDTAMEWMEDCAFSGLSCPG